MGWTEREKRRNVISNAILDALADGHPDDIAVHVEGKLTDAGYSIVENSLLLATANQLGRQHRPNPAALEENAPQFSNLGPGSHDHTPPGGGE